MIPRKLTDTTEAKAFMKGIRRNPLDNLPRLVYADWLEDNGESEYAEFIRFAVAKRGEAVVMQHPQYRRLIDYGVELFGREIAMEGWRISQDRGFIDEVQWFRDIPARKMLPVYRGCCITSVVVTDWHCIGDTIGMAGSARYSHPTFHIEREMIPQGKFLVRELLTVAELQGGWVVTPHTITPTDPKNSYQKCRKLLSDTCILSLKRLCDE